MKAALQVDYGSIDAAVVVTEVPTPVPGPGEVLIRMRGTTLNRKDLFSLQNLAGPGIRPRPPLPHVNGGDGFGDIVEIGPGVTGWTAGERVTIYGALYCGTCEFCAMGEQTACVRYGVLGEQTWGTHAEFVRVPAANLEHVPVDVDDECLLCAGGSWTTAWRALVTVARVAPGETVVIVGASGGVGTGAIRIARLAGCRVVAIVGAAWKVDRACATGADVAFEWDGAFRDRVLDVTNGGGAEVVLDTVGAATWRESVRSLRPFGRMVVCGATSGDIPAISIREVYQRHGRILGAPLGNRSDFCRLLRCLTTGQLKPVVHARLPLDAIHDGLHMLEDRTFFGKIAVHLPGDQPRRMSVEQRGTLS